MTAPHTIHKLNIGAEFRFQGHQPIKTDMTDSGLPRQSAAESRTVQRADDVVAREMGDRAVLIHLRTNRIFELNATGLRVWEMLEHAIARDEICRRLEQELRVPALEVGQAVDGLLDDLERERLIRG